MKTGSLIARWVPMWVSASVLIALPAMGVAQTGAAAKPVARVITLTQRPCQFVESENGANRGYKSTRNEDCERINAKTGAERLAVARPIELKSGRYVFRVANQGVPYELGFWLRGDGAINRVKLPSVSGGGLKPGASRDYEIDLVPGEYVYSCPLNTTPDYRLIVKN